jgi:hypothetical protein
MATRSVQERLQREVRDEVRRTILREAKPGPGPAKLGVGLVRNKPIGDPLVKALTFSLRL